jgi:hypothetical protein
MKAKWVSGVIAAHTFLASEVDRSKWLASRPGSFTSSEKMSYPLDRRLGGQQSRSGRCDEKKKGLEPPIIQPVTQRYTTDLSRLLTI